SLGVDRLHDVDDRRGRDGAVVPTVDELVIVEVTARTVVFHRPHGHPCDLPRPPEPVPVRAPPHPPPPWEGDATVRRDAVAAAFEVVEVLEVGEPGVAR